MNMKFDMSFGSNVGKSASLFNSFRNHDRVLKPRKGFKTGVSGVVKYTFLGGFLHKIYAAGSQKRQQAKNIHEFMLFLRVCARQKGKWFFVKNQDLFIKSYGLFVSFAIILHLFNVICYQTFFFAIILSFYIFKMSFTINLQKGVFF